MRPRGHFGFLGPLVAILVFWAVFGSVRAVYTSHKGQAQGGPTGNDWSAHDGARLEQVEN